MEASTLQRKKNTISKGKLKKNIKNVLCRPDQVFWPEITEAQGERLELTLKKYKIKIPEFKKPHWKELKLIPKEKRPRPPKLNKVDGLLFGITECSIAMQNDQCSAIIIEATINPKMIVQPLLEICMSKEIPVLCMKDLRKLTLTNFGVKTSCLGLKNKFLTDVRNEILNISKLHPKSKPIQLHTNVEKMDVEEKKYIETDAHVMDITESPYLYRTNKRTRVFVPNGENQCKATKKFIGQDFIEFSDKVEKNPSKTYMKMVLKRISNNPDRCKKK